MAFCVGSRSGENLKCSVCYEIFREPVILMCTHSFCRACLQRWWSRRTTLDCPLCKQTSSQRNPPLNLVLKNLCDAFLQERAERLAAGSAALCSLHAEKLKLFCLDHQQPVCIICLHSTSHIGHTVRPIDEAAQDYREVLRELLKPLQQKLEVFKDIKGNFDQTAKDIEVQAQDTERQIKDVFSMLQRFLKKEEEARLGAVRKEKQQKSQTMKTRSVIVSRETAALSDVVRATEEALRADDLSFLHRYKAAADVAQQSLPDDPQPIPEGLMDMTKHLNNLPSAVLDSIKRMISTSEYNQRTDCLDRL